MMMEREARGSHHRMEVNMVNLFCHNVSFSPEIFGCPIEDLKGLPYLICKQKNVNSEN